MQWTHKSCIKTAKFPNCDGFAEVSLHHLHVEYGLGQNRVAVRSKTVLESLPLPRLLQQISDR